jgi:hypothetical protein
MLLVTVVFSQKRLARAETLRGVVQMEVVEATEETPSYVRYYIEEKNLPVYLSSKTDLGPLFNKEVVLRGVRYGSIPILDQNGALVQLHSSDFEVQAVEKVTDNPAVDSLIESSTIVGPLTLPPPSRGQERAMIAISIMPANNPTPQWSTEWLRGKLFTNSDSLRNFILENSYRQYSLKGFYHPLGDVTPWITTTVPIDSSNCGAYYTAVRAQVVSMLESQGYPMSQYRTQLFLFRYFPECPGAAFASAGPFGETQGVRIINFHVGQSFNETSSTVQDYINTIVHELGHNLGQGAHSNSQEIEGGPTQEYGDNADPMGAVRSFYLMFSNVIRMKLGWFAATARYVVVDTRGSHSVFLQTPAIPTKGVGPNSPSPVYIIPIRNPDGSLTNEVYIIERRRNVNQFERFDTDTIELSRGLMLRKHNVDLTYINYGSILINPRPGFFPCCKKAVIPFGGVFTTVKNITFSVGFGTPQSLPVKITLPDYYPATLQEAELSYRELHAQKK